MLLLQREDIERVFSMKDAIEADKEAFALASAQKAVMPLRTTLSATDSTFLFMPSYAEELKYGALKTVNVFPGNAEKGIPVTQGLITLMDGETGAFAAVLDGTYVTALRTGASAGAAFDLFARKDASVGALIGTGGQAQAQLEAMICNRNLKEVRVFSRREEKRIAFAKRMNDLYGSGSLCIIPVPSADEAVTGADVIAAATTSTTPVIKGDCVKAGAVVCGVGSYTPHMVELDVTLLKKAASIYVDSKEAVWAEAGDFLIPEKTGEFSRSDITGEVGDVINGIVKGREHEDDIIVFKSVGIGVQDLVTAARIYEKAKAAQVGTQW